MNTKRVRFATYVQAVMKLYSKKANKYYGRTGKRLLSKEQINERLEICYDCKEFNGKKCTLCGCCTGSQENHFNKLAYPTESCPMTPPKWTSVQ